MYHLIKLLSFSFTHRYETQHINSNDKLPSSFMPSKAFLSSSAHLGLSISTPLCAFPRKKAPCVLVSISMCQCSLLSVCFPPLWSLTCLFGMFRSTELSNGYAFSIYIAALVKLYKCCCFNYAEFAWECGQKMYGLWVKCNFPSIFSVRCLAPS